MIETASIDNKVRQIIANIRNLPTPPIVFHQIQKVMNDPYVSAGQIASILSEDPAMSVKVLKLTNSAFYGLSREVDSVKQAVVIVGLEAIKNLVLSASVLEMFKGQDIDREFQEEFWRHSLATGFCGRILAKALTGKGRIDPDSAFSAGLLHDIGKMIFSCFLRPIQPVPTMTLRTKYLATIMPSSEDFLV
ncbi:MAG: HDOD domain-containing protein [Candidatus Zixiibacteriota bacterium]